MSGHRLIISVIAVLVTGIITPVCAGQILKVKLVDARTTYPVNNTGVFIRSDNDVECVFPPCGIVTKSWNGVSNNDGLLSIPKKILQYRNTIIVNGYVANILHAKNKWPAKTLVVELLSTNDSENGRVWFKKLVDAKTRKPIRNQKVLLSPDRDCTMKACRRVILETQTNDLGNIMYVQKKLWGFRSIWVITRNYESGKLIRHERRHRIKLDKRH